MTKKDVICLGIGLVLLIPNILLTKSTVVGCILATILGIIMAVIAHEWNVKDNSKNKN
jgi:hypothetical protein